MLLYSQLWFIAGKGYRLQSARGRDTGADPPWPSPWWSQDGVPSGYPPVVILTSSYFKTDFISV